MDKVFYNAKAFNSQLVWDTSKVTTMKSTFEDAKSFNQPLVWDTSKVTSMAQTFYGADGFSQDLAWDTSQVYCPSNPNCANFGAFGQCARLVPADGRCVD